MLSFFACKNAVGGGRIKLSILERRKLMKKLIIALLAIAVIFSFVGCDDKKVEDKSEEVVQTFTGFMEAMKESMSIMLSIENEGEFNLEETEYKSGNVLGDLVDDYLRLREKKAKVQKKTGTIIAELQGEAEEMRKISLKASDVKIEVSYEEDKTAKLEFSIEAEMKMEASKEGKEVVYTIDVKSFTLNGKMYKPLSASFKIENESGETTILYAKYDGKNVNKDLLESVLSLEIR